MDYTRTGLGDKLSVTTNHQRSNKERIFQDFRTTLSKLEKHSLKKWKKDLQRSNISQAVDLVKKYFKWTPLDPDIRARYTKNNAISKSLMADGQMCQEKGCYEGSIRLFSQALLFAVPGEHDVTIAYAQRSVALEVVGSLEESIRDVDLALKGDCPDDQELLEGLQQRKSKLLAELEEQLKNPTYDQHVTKDLFRLNSFYRQMFTLKSPNPLAPALEDCIDIKYNSERGRHLVANRDIPIGTTVLVETPVVAALEGGLKMEVDYCHHCLKINLQCIPCPNCVFALYCNEKCQAEASHYHQYECPCLPDLHCALADDMDENFHLIFKLICQMGPTKMFQIFKDRKEKSNYLSESLDKDNKTLIAGCDPETGIFDHHSYRATYNLATSKSHLKKQENYYYTLLSLILARTLRENTTFFDSIFDSSEPSSESSEPAHTEREEFEDFLAEQIQHHFTSFRVNVFGLGGIEGMNGVTLWRFNTANPKIELKFNLGRSASGLFPATSLINHACDQNVVRFSGNTSGVMAIVNIKPLKKGQELLLSYGPLYGNKAKAEETTGQRREQLKIYNFLCECNACKFNWPRVQDLSSVQPKFCCPVCGDKFSHENKMSKEFAETVLKGNYKCTLCKTQYDKNQMKDEYGRLCKKLEVCLDLIERNSALAAIPSLMSSLEFLETHLAPPNYLSLRVAKFYRMAVHNCIFFASHDCNL